MLHKIPFLSLAVAMGCGIIFHEFYSISNVIVFSAIFITFSVVILFALSNYKQGLVQYNRWLGLCILVCLFFTAYEYASSVTKSKPIWPQNEDVLVRATLLENPKHREKSHRVEVEVMYYSHLDTVKPSTGKALLYFSKDTQCASWKMGDQVDFVARLNEIDTPQNPGEFNLQAYNKRKGIYYRSFVNAKNVLYHEPAKGFDFLASIYQAREYFMSISAKHFNSPAEKALSDALVLGYQDDLDEETITRFSKSGTSHVLAVSGLHVGILWLVIDTLLFFLDRNQVLRVFKFFLGISILWSYAVLTGLSPSVMRAAIMFSALATAGLIKRKYSSINVLFASAAFQMLIDPMVLFNIGFQLSYAAVGSILVFYKPIKNSVYFPNKYLRSLWELTSLTLAAQIITTPISLYWFGQFPVWFIFSNLLLVPLSSLALIVGLAAFVLDWLPYMSDLLFHLFILSIKSMDELAAFFGNLPYGLLYFRIGLLDVFLLYAFVITLSLFLVKKQVLWFKSFVCVICCFFAAMLFNEIYNIPNKQWIVYGLRQGTVIRYYSDRKIVEYKSELVDRKGYSYSIKPSNKFFDVRSTSEAIVKNGFLTLDDKRIVLLDKYHLANQITEPIVCDWLVIEALKYIDFDKLQHNFKFEKLIISGSNTLSSKKYWKKECAKRNIEYYDVSESGALITMK